MTIPLPQLDDAIERQFHTVSISSTVLEAIAVMHGCNRTQSHEESAIGHGRASCVLVVDDGKLVGILTERDIVKLMAAGGIVPDVMVTKTMTADVVSLREGHDTSDFSEALQHLRQSRIRHLPVVDDDRRPTGLITSNSIRRTLQPANLMKLRRVRDVMTSRVQSSLASATVQQVVAQMHLQRVSCSVVVEIDDSGELVRPVGIVTERDIVRLRHHNLDFHATLARDVMSAPLHCLHPDDSLAIANETMQQMGVQRLVVAGDRGELAGIVTQTSMLQAVDLTEMHSTIETLKQVVNERTRELREEVTRRGTTEQQLREANRLLQQEIEDRHWIERELFREKELAQVTLQSIGEAVIATDARGRVSSMNPLAERYTGWKHLDASGRIISQIFVTFDETTQFPCECATQQVLRDKTVVHSGGLAAMKTRDGRTLSVESTTAPICDRAGELVGTVTVFRDVSEARQLARQLSHQARHDSLTGLLNRSEFERRLEAAIASARHGDLQHVLCYLDLDQFKIVNDTCGHEAGDELLRQLTLLLRQEIRASDILARLGGDEFGLLLFQCPLDRAERIADQFRERIAQYRFVWQDKIFAVGVSIGLVNIDEHTRELTQVLSAADAACYAAKSKGRNRIQIYPSSDVDLKRQRGERRWAAQIERALMADRFVLFAQDIVPIASAQEKAPKQRHCEILVRMLDEQGEIVPPMAFIPAAERYGLMPQIDRWVVGAFFQQYRQVCALHESLPCGRVFAINLSGKSLNDDAFMQFLERELSQPPLAPEHLCFEITETAAIANLSVVTAFIHKLKQLGCRFALDDFGSGMSSFTYLKMLPVDYLKIDGSFIKAIADSRFDRILVESFIEISREINVQTIAEYVENDTILAVLADLGADFAQGYGIAKPVPLQFEQPATLLTQSVHLTDELGA